jgi:NADH pyrophosphatase NudC (nudix superfamily)
MPTHQPFLTTAQGTRHFACSAIAVQAIILNAAEQVLLLSSPTKNRSDEWQVISGAREAAETVLAGVLREVRDEAGPTCRSGLWAWCMPRPSILIITCHI